MAINTAIITTPGAAVKAQAEVKRKRSVAKALAKDGDITGARFELAEAADLDRAAAAILDPSNVLLNPLVAGRGGELVVPTKENMMDRPGLVDTANSDPDMLTAAASVPGWTWLRMPARCLWEWMPQTPSRRATAWKRCWHIRWVSHTRWR